MANFELLEYEGKITDDCETLITYGYVGTDKTSIALKAAQEGYIQLSALVGSVITVTAVEIKDDKIFDLVSGQVREVTEDKDGCFRIQNLSLCQPNSNLFALKMIEKFFLKRKGHVLITIQQ